MCVACDHSCTLLYKGLDQHSLITDSKFIEMLYIILFIASSLAIAASSYSNKPLCCHPEPLPASCNEIKNKWPKASSGYYHIGGKGGPVYVYCQMEEICGSGGWTRLACLDMTDPAQKCPSGFKLIQTGQVRTCGRPNTTTGSCASVHFQSHGISYSQVCGKVIGYQHGTPDGIYPGHYAGEKYGSVIDSHVNINSYYVDGVSITRGYPRQHVWTLINGLFAAILNNKYDCPCHPGSLQKSTLQNQLKFIGNDYFCESGNSVGTHGGHYIYSSDPLWDGKACSNEGDCCKAPGLPWFNKVLKAATTDYLELRLCQDEGTKNEDSPLRSYELYVK